MKKLLLSITLIFCFSISAFADYTYIDDVGKEFTYFDFNSEEELQEYLTSIKSSIQTFSLNSISIEFPNLDKELYPNFVFFLENDKLIYYNFIENVTSINYYIDNLNGFLSFKSFNFSSSDGVGYFYNYPLEVPYLNGTVSNFSFYNGLYEFTESPAILNQVIYDNFYYSSLPIHIWYSNNPNYQETPIVTIYPFNNFELLPFDVAVYPTNYDSELIPPEDPPPEDPLEYIAWQMERIIEALGDLLEYLFIPENIDSTLSTLIDTLNTKLHLNDFIDFIKQFDVAAKPLPKITLPYGAEMDLNPIIDDTRIYWSWIWIVICFMIVYSSYERIRGVLH